MAQEDRPRVEALDLRGVTRHSGRVRTRVLLKPPYESMVPWIEAGSSSLSRRGNREVPIWTLASYLTEGVTDFEHDSAYAFGIDLIGLEFDHTFYGKSLFRAFVNPVEPDGFRVPPPEYDPSKLDGAHKCKSCKDRHLIVPEGWYYPPVDKKLWAALRGTMVQIEIGPAPEE